MSDFVNFWEKFSPGHEVPERIRKFLHRNRIGYAMGQTTAYYAHGYAFAFQRLVIIAIDLWPQADYLRMPVFFLARHAAELQLKEVIQGYSARNRAPYRSSNEHRLITL